MMNRKERREATKEVGLEATYRVLKFFADTEYLHYGRFEPDIPRDVRHIRQAQDRYLERLIELIPSQVRSILDVGAGSGKTAEVLLQHGFKVDCVSPGRVLGDIVERRLEGRSHLFRGRFEEVAIPDHYDLVLFSESFQYIPFEVALTKAGSLLNPGGHIMICDFFRRAGVRGSPLGGGHDIGKWEAHLSRSDFDVVVDQDITEETAPVCDLLEEMRRELLAPLSASASAAAAMRWPVLMRLLRRFFRSDLDRLANMSRLGVADGAEFRRAKVYKIHLLRRRSA